MVDIKGLDKADVLAELYNYARPQGMGFIHYDPTPMTREVAEKFLADNFSYSDYAVNSMIYYDYQQKTFMRIDRRDAELKPVPISREELMVKIFSFWEVAEALPRIKKLDFDYLQGRVMKVDITGDEFEEWLYDRDNGEGKAASVIECLRERLAKIDENDDRAE